MDNIDSKTIDSLRFPCACLVVVIHIFSSVGGANYEENGFYDIVRIMLSQGIARLAVPVFFLTSGYLFFKGLSVWKWDSYFSKIKKRIRTLLVPYLLWNLIIILFYLLLFCVKGNWDGAVSFLSNNGGLLSFWNCARFEYVPRVNLLGWEMWDGAFPVNYPLWFIRDLIVLNIAAPLIYFFIRRLQFLWIVLLAVLYISDIWFPWEGLRSEGFFFYSLGGYLCINDNGIYNSFSRVRTVMVPLALLSLFFCVVSYGGLYQWYARKLFCVFGTIALIWLVAKYINKHEKTFVPNRFLIEASFVIFAAHAIGVKDIVCALLNKVIYIIHINNAVMAEIINILAFLIAPIIVVTIILLLYAMAKRVMPYACLVLTGGRINIK